MPQSNNVRTLDFPGFLDGIRASNLATIERNTALQVSELQIRLQMMQKGLQSNSPVAAKVDELRETLRDSNKTIVERLVSVGNGFRDVLLQYRGDYANGSPQLAEASWVVQRYAEAAERAHDSQVMDIALSLGDAWQEITAHS